MSRADGFKPGTNYNQKMRADHAARASAQIAAALAQDVLCARGEHDETVVPPRHVAWIGGERVPSGTRYCRRCRATLGKGD